MLLDGKIAIVTGGSRGIGKAIALTLASNGAHIAINYSGNLEAAQEVKELVIGMERKAETYQCDVSNSVEVDQMVKQIAHDFGRIDILVNNAGITKDNLLIRLKEEDWDQVISVNLKGVYNCTKSVGKLMIKQKSGKIINISSIVGITGNYGQSNYAAAKAGIIGFSKSAAKEYSSRGINVNVIAPGFINTDMTEILSPEIKEKMLSQIPLAKFGKPEDVANLALFLASNLSDYITGQVISVDGGMLG